MIRSTYCPDRKVLAEVLLEGLVQILLEIVKQLLSEAESGAATSDCWTAINTESFIAITVHWIDECFEMQKLTAGVLEINASHT